LVKGCNLLAHKAHSAKEPCCWVGPQGEIQWEFVFNFQLNLDFGKTL
jgi:hypothetical protein